MKTLTGLVNILVRVCGAGALALGIASWLGYWSLTRIHMAFGIGLVLSLWAMAAIAWWNASQRGLAAFAIAWGFLTWLVGVTQIHLLPGSSHWVVEFGHLAIGVISIALASSLARGVARARVATTYDGIGS